MLEKVERNQKVDYYKETVHLVIDNSFITKGFGLAKIYCTNKSGISRGKLLTFTPFFHAFSENFGNFGLNLYL